MQIFFSLTTFTKSARVGTFIESSVETCNLSAAVSLADNYQCYQG